jgi:flap endonuclease-1
MYRFIGENKLVEHMYLMVSIFLQYGIRPIFVFDGAPPPEKKEVLNERRENKKSAQAKYELLKQTHAVDTEEMEKLKRQFIFIKEADYAVVKSLLNSYGVAWTNAPGEADELCAHLMHTNQVFACLSDDMDMFAYGCRRVLRHFSLVKHNVLFYDLSEVLQDIEMTVQEFRQVLVMSGTDYNNRDSSNNLAESIRLFRNYKKDMILCEDNEIPSFYTWLSSSRQPIQNLNLEKLDKILKMFRPREKMEFVLHEGQYNKKMLFDILAVDGFMFSSS